MDTNEYKRLKRHLYGVFQEVRQAKIQLLEEFITVTFPDVEFDIFTHTENAHNLDMSIALKNLDKAETNVVFESVNHYLQSLEKQVQEERKSNVP